MSHAQNLDLLQRHRFHFCCGVCRVGSVLRGLNAFVQCQAQQYGTPCYVTGSGLDEWCLTALLNDAIDQMRLQCHVWCYMLIIMLEK